MEKDPRPVRTWEQKVRRVEADSELMGYYLERLRLQQGDPAYLLSQPVVVDLCNDFLQDLSKYIKYYDPSQGDYVGGIVKICVKYAEIFCGKDPKYTPAKDWTGEPLAKFIMKHGTVRPRGEGKEASNPVAVLKTYFLAKAEQYITNTMAEVRKEISPGTYQDFVAHLVLDMVNDLRGIIDFDRKNVPTPSI